MALAVSSMSLWAQPPASISKKLAVPASLRSAPFNVDRYLTVPPDFSIELYARIPQARFMAVTPDGDLLVSRPNSGSISLIRPNGTGDALVSTFASGMRLPHDMVFHTIGSTTYLYVAESNQISRAIYRAGDLAMQGRQIVVPGLPDSSSAELKGSYGHQLKNIALGPDHKLYVSIASATNASVSDAISNPVRCAIYQYNADGSGGRLFARGLRNAEGLAILPGTNTLWVTINQRDNIAFPFHQDITGDGSDDYGKVIGSYVDNHPPEGFTSVIGGGNYGWPYANPNPDTASGLNNMPFDFDYQNNNNWSVFPQNTFSRVAKGIQAHSAPLGFSFLQGSGFAQAYRNGAVVALHGSWNRSRKVGYKITYYPWQSSSLPGVSMDLVRGWLDEATQNAWGRPVDVVPGRSGELYISDDAAGAIYKLTLDGPPPDESMTVAELLVVNTDTDQVVGRMADGSSINRAVWPRFTIAAQTSPAVVGSVRFEGRGTPAVGGAAIPFSTTENVSPYALAGENSSTDYLAWTPPAGLGTYELQITPYSGANATGRPGVRRSVSFAVSENAPVIGNFSLINADTNQIIAGFGSLVDGMTIDLSSLPTRNLNIVAAKEPATGGSVRLTLRGPVNLERLENIFPFCLGGDNAGDFLSLNPALRSGSYVLTAVAHAGSDGSGTTGLIKTISIRFVD